MIITIYVATLVLFTPMFLLYTTSWTVDPYTNATIAVLSHRPNFLLHPDLPRQVIAIITGVLKPTAVLVVIVSSVVVVVKLGAARRMRKLMADSQRGKITGQSEAKITQMLLSLCILFVVLTLPETTGILVNYFLSEFGLKGCYHNTFDLFFRVMSVGSCLNSSVNFVAYVSLSAKFRRSLSQMLLCPTFRGNETNAPKQVFSAASL